jgi:hypothetical protein
VSVELWQISHLRIFPLGPLGSASTIQMYRGIPVWPHPILDELANAVEVAMRIGHVAEELLRYKGLLGRVAQLTHAILEPIAVGAHDERQHAAGLASLDHERRHIDDDFDGFYVLMSREAAQQHPPAPVQADTLCGRDSRLGVPILIYLKNSCEMFFGYVRVAAVNTSPTRKGQ